MLGSLPLFTFCLFVFKFLAAPRGMPDLVPQPRTELVSPAVGARTLNRWTAGKVFTNVFPSILSKVTRVRICFLLLCVSIIMNLWASIHIFAIHILKVYISPSSASQSLFEFPCVRLFFLCPFDMLPLLLLSRFSRVRLCATPWIAACQASISITNSLHLVTSLHGK